MLIKKGKSRTTFALACGCLYVSLYIIDALKQQRAQSTRKVENATLEGRSRDAQERCQAEKSIFTMKLAQHPTALQRAHLLFVELLY